MNTKVNNEMYRRCAADWWNDDVGEFSTLRFFVNPVRFRYFLRVFRQSFGEQEELTPPTLLDVGCGGGFLSEEFARAGFVVTGIDPAPETIEVARQHACVSNLTIEYRVGVGEFLPFADASFGCVACCDVLEHVDDPELVVKEIARVLKPGGLFFYDTINRTFISKIALIKIAQEWRSTAIGEPNAHVWSHFVKPGELVALMKQHGLESREMRGISPHANPLIAYLNLRRCVRGRISFRELGQFLRIGESNSLSVSYMGFATRVS